MFDWLTGDVIPLGDKDTRLIVIGTKLHNDSIIMKLKKEILENRMDGAVRAYPFLNPDGKALWHSKFPTEADIQTLRKSVPSPQAWQREYMLQIIADDDQVVRMEWIQKYKTLPSDADYRYAASGVDPAISEKETADYTAIVSGIVFGRKNNLKIYILPNPTNERMDFPKSLEKIKGISNVLGNGVPSTLFIEGVAYQKSLIEQLRAEGFPAKEYKPQGSDKRARLSLASNLIQSGRVLFPENGAERLIAQITGFGTESHDDLSDAFCILVLSVLEQESKVIKGHIELFSEYLLKENYYERIPMTGEKRLGVIVADKYRTYSTIVLRAENVAEVLYYEMNDDIDTLARKVVELAKNHDVPISDQSIFVDKTGRGHDLCRLISQYAQGRFLIGKYANSQRYGINLTDPYQYNDGLYEDLYAAGYAKLAKWLRNGGKLLGKPIFDNQERASAKKFRGGSSVQGGKRNNSPSRDQESLPGSRQPDVVVAAVAPIVADAEPVGIEVADVDTVTARVETGRPNVNAFEESDTTNLEIGRDEPAHLGGVRHLLECREKLVLLVPRLAGRVRNRRLLDQEPPEGRLVLAGELLIGIPTAGLRVEVGGLDLPNVERGARLRRCRHDGITVVLAPLENVLRRQTFSECRDLFDGVNDARASLGDFLGRNEIRAED